MAETAPPGTRPRSSMVALALSSLFASNRGSLFTVYFSLYLVEVKGASIAVALTLISVAFVGASLVGPLAGRLSDRTGRRKPFLLVGEGLALPLLLSIPFLPGYLPAGLAFIAGQVAAAIGTPALNAYVVDTTQHGERGRWYGLLGATNAMGAAIGFPIAGYLMDLYGFEALFLVAGTVMLLAFSTVLVLLPDITVPVTRAPRSLREMRSISIFSFAVSIRAIGWGAVVTFYGTFAYLLGANAFDISLIALSGYVVGAIISVPMGQAVDRMGALRSVLLGAAISLGAMLIFLVTTTWIELFPAQITYRIGFALMNPAMLSWVGGMAPTGRRAEYLGFFSMINSTLWSSGPLVGAVSLSLGGSTGLFLMATGATLISVISLPLLYRSELLGPRRATPPEVEGLARAHQPDPTSRLANR